MNWRNPLRQHIILFQFYLKNNSKTPVNIKDYFLKHMQFSSGDNFSLKHMNDLNSDITNKISYDFGSNFYINGLANFNSTVKPNASTGFMVIIPRNSNIYNDIVITFHQDNGEVIAMKRLTPQYPNIPTYGK